MRIYLTGYMGAGKTTLGKALAERMQLSFIDADSAIENRLQRKISEIFASEGEARFREIEHGLLRELSAVDNVVVATGGGLPCFNNNMALMNATGVTVYLEATADELAARLETCKATRPVLQNRSGNELAAFVGENLTKRRPYYEQAAIRFDAGRMNSDEDVERLARQLEALIMQT